MATKKTGKQMSNDPAVTRVVGSLPKAPDVECHVRIVEVENVKLVEFRDYIPSLGEYGRGYWMPLTEDSVYGMASLLTEVANGELGQR